MKHTQAPYISIVIATRNRPKQLSACVESIFKSTYRTFEVIIVDQSTNNDTSVLISKISDARIRYYKQKYAGLSKARNYGVKLAKGLIITFTDDDCIPDEQWLAHIYKSLSFHKDVWGVFGRTEPYIKEYKNKICPCTFQGKKMKIFDSPTKHWESLGFGNNMSFRKKIFEKIGFFDPLLGLGSPGLSAEDAEFSLRILTNNYRLMYNPQVLVYHDRLVSYEEFTIISLSYSCGEMACYGYYALSGVALAKAIIEKNFYDSFKKITTGLKQFFYMKETSMRMLGQSCTELAFRLRGLVIALMIYLKRSVLF